MAKPETIGSMSGSTLCEEAGAWQTAAYRQPFNRGT